LGFIILLLLRGMSRKEQKLSVDSFEKFKSEGNFGGTHSFVRQMELTHMST